MVGQGLIKGQHGFGFKQFKTRNRQLAAEVEELVLDFDKQRAHALGHGLTQQHTDVRVEFVHLTHGVHPQRVFAHARVVAQAGGAVVAGAGGDLCESVAHKVFIECFLPSRTVQFGCT